MESSAGLYAGPSCTPEKAEKAKIIFEQLFGVIKARKYFDVKFNIANHRMDEVKDFLLSNEYLSLIHI